MHTAPRFDLVRTEIDNLHAKCFALNNNFKIAHKRFVKAIKTAFSPLTESAAISYAKATYNTDIEEIEQYFNVERNGWVYDIVLITAETNAKQAYSKQVQASFKCIEQAMDTCKVLNSLFEVELMV